MPFEWPITLIEFHNTATLTILNNNIGNPESMTRRCALGWKLSAVEASYFQLSVHEMDPRPGHNRLLIDPLVVSNVSKAWFFPVDAQTNLSDLLGNRFFIRAFNQYINYDTIVLPEQWAIAREIGRTAITGGWLPERSTGDAYLLCDTCPLPLFLHNSSRHATCGFEDCGVTLPRERFHRFAFLESYDEVILYFCYGHDEYEEQLTELYPLVCVDCERRGLESSFTDLLNFEGFESVRLCLTCYEEAYWCEVGNHWTTDEDIEDDICRRCSEASPSPSHFIQSWNFRPNLEFHPEIPTNPLRPLYIGMELELSWPGYFRGKRREAYGWLEDLYTNHSDVLYVKSDSSVNQGFEVVTHPMEPDWALENFPFSLFQDAIDYGALPTHSSTGTHIHIDKASLTTAQVWKLLKLHSNLQTLCGQIGGRGCHNTYADWNEAESIWDRAAEIAQQKGKAFGSMERYVPINVLNEQTLELRYMSGGIEPHIIKKNIEWVKALYDFTDHISVQDIQKGVLNDQSYLLGWVLNGTYPSVAQFLKTWHPAMVPSAMPERTT
jgi:hypothetical protein